MKLRIKTIGVLFIGIVLLLISCKGVEVNTESAKQAELEINESILANEFVGSHYKGNFVWGVAMNIAWNELSNSVLHQKLSLASSDKTVKQIENAFNSFPLSKNVLDKESYYTKAGYGSKTLAIINEEVQKKFPHKSFADLNMKLNETDIISYAYFVKAVKYLYAFSELEFDFMGTKVKGFYAKTSDQKKSVNVVKYESDDKFIISLNLKESDDSLLLAKGYDMKNPKQVLKVINQEKTKGSLLKSDHFYAPNIKLDYKRDYKELLGKHFANKGFEKYFIAKMFENIKFEMDKKGAKVENEAVIIAVKSAMLEESRNFVLDKPYWVIMKREKSDMPYFLLGVNNTELMEKASK